MNLGNAKGIVVSTTVPVFACVAAIALAADSGNTRSAPPGSAFSRSSPNLPTATPAAQPAAAPTAAPAMAPSAAPAPANAPAPAGALPAATATPQRVADPANITQPAQAGKPDYAIALGTQQEFKNTALGWTFRIDNLGKAAPIPEKPQSPSYGGMVWGAASPTAARLVISVGQPCPQPVSWKPLESIPIPVLQPGASVVLPKGLYMMPDDYVGKGCRFQAEIKGPEGDANAANNVMHMIGKTAMLPDLIVVFGVYKGGPGGNLDVVNAGNAPAGPSKFHFECETTDQNIHCNPAAGKWSAQTVLDVPVPALKPGEHFQVKGSTPKGETVVWKGWADRENAVLESNESNNTLAGGNKSQLYKLSK